MLFDICVYIQVCVLRRIVQYFLKAFRRTYKLKKCLYQVLMFGTLVPEHSRTRRIRRIPGIIPQRNQKHSEFIGGSGILFNLLDKAGICHSHSSFSFSKLIAHIGGICFLPFFAKIPLIGKFFELI